jgi:hypothetical protein
MQIGYIILTAALVIFIVLLSYLAYWIYNLKKPSPGNCDYLRKSQPDVKWSADCSYIEEIAPDNSLATPTSPLFLTNFTNSPSFNQGQPLGANVWYRYRYVNGKTGGYGKFSPWTVSPIIAGSTTLPCQLGKGKCVGVSYTGRDSCQSNLVQLGANNLNLKLGSDIYVNIHRYSAISTDTTPPTDSTVDKIVGMLLPKGQSGSGFFIDISDSACKEVICTNVEGC